MPKRKTTKIKQSEDLKLPPQNLEAEQSVLGAIMLDKNAIIKVADKLFAEDFYDPAHSMIYEAMLALFDKRKAIDVLTLTDYLESKKELDNIGGASYLANLVNQVPTSAHVVYYAEIVHSKGVLRRLIEATSEIANIAYGESTNVDEIIDKSEQILFNVSQKFNRDNFIPIKDILAESFERIEEIHKDKGNIRGVKTGFKSFDNLTAGLQKSDLIILAARPSMGKTSFALNIAENIAVKDKLPVLIFSLEQSKEQLVDRMICSQSGLDAWKLRTGKLREEDFPKIGYAMGMLSEAPIYIDDTPFSNVMEMRAKARRLQTEKQIGLIVIDYLQLMQGSRLSRDPNRVQEISEISRGLKALARELNVPVMALSQLSRAVEHRPDKRPQLADLRESGCLAGDTLINLSKNGQRIAIKNLINKKNNSIYSLAKNFKMTRDKIIKTFSTGVKQLFKIKLANGKEIRATKNHKFLTINGWKRLDCLKKGEYLATPRQIICENYESVSENKIIILAHLIGDGCYLKHQPLHYTNADKLCLEIVDKASKNEFKTKNRMIKQKNWFHLYLSSSEKLSHNKRNPIVKWLDYDLNIFDQRSGEKIIPEIIFRLSNNQIALFIKHLFATDGSITKSAGQWRIYYASKSKKLILQLQHLLLRFGIHSIIKINKKGKYDPVYNLVITSAFEQLMFLEKIGIFGKKSINAKKAILELKKIKTNTNIDIIPKSIWQNISKRFQVLGWTSREFHKKMGWAYSGTQRYKNGISRKRLNKIAKVLNDHELKNLSNSDIFWEKIVEIKKDKKEKVYDITTLVNHNFVANDVVVHNSIEQDADIVMFIYRDDYYDPETEEKNIAEILVKKHRNGPIGSFKLYFVGEQTKFENLENNQISQD